MSAGIGCTGVDLDFQFSFNLHAIFETCMQSELLYPPNVFSSAGVGQVIGVGAVLAFARAPAWETGGVGTSQFASVRRPGWVSDAPRVASKVVSRVHTRNQALVYMCGFHGVIVTRVCTNVRRVPWRGALLFPCTSPIVRGCHGLGRSACHPMSLALTRLRGACAVLMVRRSMIRPYVLCRLFSQT